VYGKEGIGDLYFTYDSRALKYEIKEGTNYIKFKFKQDIPNDIKVEYGEAIPWFNQSGLGDQIKSSEELINLWNRDLIEIVERWEFKSGTWLKTK